MRRKSLSFALLASVTSAERAAAIEGDLLEERAVHGTWWFALHVMRTTFALFGLRLAQAPFRVAALSGAAVAASCLMCVLVGRAFFAPEAVLPAPVLGFAVIIASAVLIGAALGRTAGALGVRAAVAACVLLVLLFAVTLASGDLEQLPLGAVRDVGWLGTVGSFALKLGLGVGLYLGPLVTASACAHVRRL